MTASRMMAYASGGCAHLYVNVKGREEGGVVEPSDAFNSAYHRQLLRACIVLPASQQFG